MQARGSVAEQARATSGAPDGTARERLVDAVPAEEHRLDVDGISTALLEAGSGPPLVLLHGPGESSLWWMRVIPELAARRRVIVPDLPGHGASELPEEDLDERRVLSWLDGLIDETCSQAPGLVGHLLGGSIAARYTVDRGQRVHRLVLIDALGLRWFLPAPGFAFRLVRFMAKPTEQRYGKFLDHCMLDAEGLRAGMGETWEPFQAYYLDCAGTEVTQEAMATLMKAVGVPRIAPSHLEAIDVPTSLIWGRHDKATPLKVAKRASRRYGWPLHVIDEAGDDPKLERPGTFVEALDRALAVPTTEVA